MQNAERGVPMGLSYNRLWKLLIDKGMNKKDLRIATGISTTAMAKLGRGDNLTTDILLKICDALDCDISDICEVVRTTEHINNKAGILNEAV